MKIFPLMLILLFSRPPAPTNIPFGYDPNQCNYEVLKWYIVEQSTALQMERVVVEPDGDPVTLTMVSSDGSTEIFIEEREKTAVEDNAIKYKFYMDWRPKIRDDLGVFYLDVTATDSLGASDSRTILVNIIKPITNRPPIILE